MPPKAIDSLTGSYLSGRRLPVIGTQSTDISLKRCEVECDPLASEINASGPEPGAAGVPARRLRELSWDDDAITHHMTLG
jgi:hypothetical protein